jgi:hypothetical protein
MNKYFKETDKNIIFNNDFDQNLKGAVNIDKKDIDINDNFTRNYFNNLLGIPFMIRDFVIMLLITLFIFFILHKIFISFFDKYLKKNKIKIVKY